MQPAPRRDPRVCSRRDEHAPVPVDGLAADRCAPRRDARLARRSFRGRRGARAAPRAGRHRRDGGRSHPSRGACDRGASPAAAGYAGRAAAAGLADRSRLRRRARPLSAAPGDRAATVRSCSTGSTATPSRPRRASPTVGRARASRATTSPRPAQRHHDRGGVLHRASGVGRRVHGRGARLGVRMIAGKVLMDRHAPRALRDSARAATTSRRR